MWKRRQLSVPSVADGSTVRKKGGQDVHLKRHKSARPAKSRLGTVGRDFTKLCERNKLHLCYICIVPALGLIRRDAVFIRILRICKFFSKKIHA